MLAHVVVIACSMIGTPPRAISGAKEAFLEAQQRIREEYVDAGLSEDELWTGAIAGMLDRLIQTKQLKVNALLDPEQLRDMHEGLKGTVSGVGVVVKQFEDVVLVKEALAGGPAAAGGLKPGDRILAVDNKTVRGLTFAQIVDLIRGPEGTSVDLLVQRDQNEWTMPLTRKSITVPVVSAHMLDNRTGYLRLMSFNENTASEVAKLLDTTLKGAASIVLDLRGCPGGLFDSTLAVSELFLPPGKKIVSLRGRDGKEDIKMTKNKDRGDALPMVVMIDHDTASSAEILAAALAENDRARLVGEATLGKSTVERIVSMKSGWALKLSIARFYSPKGKSWQDHGITPDFLVAMPPSDAHEDDAQGTPERDPPLRAALSVLSLSVR